MINSLNPIRLNQICDHVFRKPSFTVNVSETLSYHCFCKHYSEQTVTLDDTRHKVELLDYLFGRFELRVGYVATVRFGLIDGVDLDGIVV